MKNNMRRENMEVISYWNNMQICVHVDFNAEESLKYFATQVAQQLK